MNVRVPPLTNSVDRLPSPSASGISSILALGALFSGGVALVLAVVFARNWVNCNCATWLLNAKLVLSGSVPYVDYVHHNPPLQDYLHIFPVLMADVTGLELATAFYLFALTVAIYSTVALCILLSKSSGPLTSPGRIFIAAAWLGFSAVMVTTSCFGEREHLFALAYVPWFYCREARHRGLHVSRGLSITIGAVAGPFFMLKPHFFAVVLLVEAWLLFRSRRFSTLVAPEVMCFLMWSLAYALHFLFMPKEMRDSFFLRWVPWALMHYQAFNSSDEVLWGRFWTWSRFPVLIAGGLAALVLLLKRRIPSPLKLQTEGILLAMVLCIAIYIVQHKGWFYQVAPAVGLGRLLLATVLIVGIYRLRGLLVRSRSSARWLTAAVFCAMCVVVIGENIYTAVRIVGHTRHLSPEQTLALFIRDRTSQNDKVMFISTDVYPSQIALLLADRSSASRYILAYPIVETYRFSRSEDDGTFPYNLPGEYSPVESQFLEESGHDIEVNRPRLVFIEAAKPCKACPRNFSIDEYLTATGWKERFLKSYDKLPDLEGFSVYSKRRGPL